MASKGGEFILPAVQLADIFTVNDLTEEQRMIRDTIREVVAKTITTDEAVKLIESKDLCFQRSLLKNLAELGFLGVEIPEDYGGANLGPVAAAIVAEEISKQGSFACTFLAHTGIGTLPLRFFGTEEQKKRYLPKLTNGEWVAAYCLTETGAGSDANSVKTVATKHDDFYILNGSKIFVTNGGFADLFTVFAQVKDYGLTAFLVERNWLAVNVGAEEHKMGIRGSSTAPVSFDNVVVPEQNVLGELGKGFKIAVNILNLGRFKLGAACLGGGRAALQESVQYSQYRKQFGHSISSFGAIRLKLAKMAAKNYAMESVVYRTAGYLQDAAHAVDTNDSKAVLKAIEEFAIECSLVKVFCSESLDYIVDENVQVHGGSGFCEGAPERHYRDSRINRIFEGTNEINRLLVVGMLLKKAMGGSLPLLSEIKKISNAAMSVSIQAEPEELIDKLFNRLNSVKNVVLLSAGLAYEKFNFGLEKHQVVLLGLSDCMMEIYAMESCLAALKKNRTKLNELLTRLIFDDSLFEIEKTVRRVISMSSEGDTNKTALAMVRRFLKFTPENIESISDKIAEDLLRS